MLREVETWDGRHIFLLSELDLVDPMDVGEYTRAYCPIHGGDRQRSLSVHSQHGWGRCFNGSCPAYSHAGEKSTVLIVERNSDAAELLIRNQERRDAGALPPPRRKGVSAPAMGSTHEPVPAIAPKPPQQWQQEELNALYALHCSGFLQEALQESRPRSYLSSRGVPVEVALAAGVGYLPDAWQLPFAVRGDERYKELARWCQRIIFPLGTLWVDQSLRMGFIGRTLFGWQPGMDENQHKAYLDAYDRDAVARGSAPLRRWRKTNPTGWFGYEPARLDPLVVVVEGAFDRLALLAAGWSATGVVALAGTAASVQWFPDHVTSVVLALDADDGGQGVTPRLAERLEQAGFAVLCCAPPGDGWGKDWSERWRRTGEAGIRALAEACDRLG